MQKLKADILRSIRTTARNEFSAAGLSDEELVLEFPKEEHGDFASPVAMRLARRLKIPPKEIAGRLCIAIRNDLPQQVQEVSVAEPGYLNFVIAKEFLRSLLLEVNAMGADYGRSDFGGGKRVQVEFVSANPTGPLTVAHGRQAAVGDALANVLEYTGHEVVREYYINDSGRQMKLLGESVYSSYCAAFGKEFAFPEDGYKGDYIPVIGREIAAQEGDRYLMLDVKDAIEASSDLAGKRILLDIRKDLEDFGVFFDVWFSQKEFERKGKVEALLRYFRENGLSYERDGAVWLRTKSFGDVEDRVLVKSNGELTYRTTDMAYHKDKFERGFELVIDLWGPDHHAHVSCMKAAVKAMGFDESKLNPIIVQYCTLYRGKEKLKMSTRAGQFITLREVMNEVGKDAARFFFVNRRIDSHLDFDLELAKEQSDANPVYYIQYGHARISSIIEFASHDGRFSQIEVRDGSHVATAGDLTRLGDSDLRLVREIMKFPDVVERAARQLEPQVIAAYLYELVTAFHNYYTWGVRTGNRVVSEDIPLSRARLCLVHAVRTVIRNGLRLLGVSAPDKM